MRVVLLLATMALVLDPPPASADTQLVTLAGTRIELTASDPLAITAANDGWLVTAPFRPAIWLGLEPDACGPSARTLSMLRPLGYFATLNLPDPAPPGAARWHVLCVAGEGVTARVLVEVQEPMTMDAYQYVDGLLAAIRVALRPPLEVAPRVVLHRAQYDGLIRAGGSPDTVLVDEIALSVSLDAPRCPPSDEPPAPAGPGCRELPDRAVVVALRDLRRDETAPLPPFALRVRDDLLRAAQQAYGTAFVVTGHYRPRWANGEVPLERLPGAWKLSTVGDTVHLHAIDGAGDVEITPGPCLPSATTAGATMPRPPFLPAGATVAEVDTTAGWVARACVPVIGTPAVVTFRLRAAPEPAAAQAFAAALTEVPGAPRTFLAAAGESNGTGFGVLIDGWMAGRLSWFGQFEVYDSGAESNGRLSSARLAIGAGPGFSRPTLRAGLHLGLALERAAMDERAGLDQNGGAVFVEGRVHAGRHGFVQALARGAYYFDLDCTDVRNDDEIFCGPSNHADHHAQLGGELEVRLGLGTRRQGFLVGGFVGARYLALRTDAGSVERHALFTLGFATW